MKGVVFHYDALADFVAVVRGESANPANNVREDYDRGWICADRRDIQGYASACVALESPSFDAGVARIERLSKQVQAPTPINVRRRARRGPEGDELDMQRVWQGELDTAWRLMKREHSVGPSRVVVAIDACAAWDLNADALAWRGVAALALAERLQDAGHSVRIVAYVTGQMKDDSLTPYLISVVVQEAGTPIDIHKAANLLASGLFLRGGVLNHIRRTAKGEIGGGVLRVADVTEEQVRDPNADRTFLMPQHVTNERMANTWVAERIAEIDARYQ